MFEKVQSHLFAKASKIKLLLTDCDGVLTDTGVYYADSGEAMKRFSIRDGMGVERLRTLCNIDTGIITGESNELLKARAQKLKITMLFLGIKHKSLLLDKILADTGFTYQQIAYIGDDTNDVELLEKAGLSATPADGTIFAKNVVDYICTVNGGYGAFREFAELIIQANQELPEFQS